MFTPLQCYLIFFFVTARYCRWTRICNYMVGDRQDLFTSFLFYGLYFRSSVFNCFVFSLFLCDFLVALFQCMGYTHSRSAIDQHQCTIYDCTRCDSPNDFMNMNNFSVSFFSFRARPLYLSHSLRFTLYNSVSFSLFL